MGENTKIEWCDHSWSPWRGCTKVSPGCANCYAASRAKRFGEPWGKGSQRILSKSWSDPVKWNKDEFVCQDCGQWDRGVSGDCVCGQYGATGKIRSATVFPSLCDWLDDEVPVQDLARFLKLTHDTPNLRWLLLTKRPENWHGRMSKVVGLSCLTGCEPNDLHGMAGWLANRWLHGFAPTNIWVGTSVEDQPRADDRILELLKIKAAGLFLSMEPLLGPVELTRIEDNDGNSLDALTGDWAVDGRGHTGPNDTRINWVIVGGESGPGARPCNIDWIRSIVRQCAKAGVPCFVKQLGSRPVEHQNDEDGCPLGTLNLALKHPKGGDPAEWPEDLRVRQFPWGGGK